MSESNSEWFELVEFLQELTKDAHETNEHYKKFPDDGHEFSEFVGELRMLEKIVNKIHEIKGGNYVDNNSD